MAEPADAGGLVDPECGDTVAQAAEACGVRGEGDPRPLEVDRGSERGGVRGAGEEAEDER